MNPAWLRLFHRLPAPARSALATARGHYLRAWRYGGESSQLVAEALERDHWSPAQWRSFREDRLARLLHRAVRDVPYYRELWTTRRRHGDQRSPEYLENWPVLDKEPVRQNPRAFLADNCDPRRMFTEHTSGTSGTPLTLWWSRETVRAWYALFEARSRRWYGLTRTDRWAIIGGQLVAPASQRRPPFWVWNAAFNQLYMSSYHLAPHLLPAYVNALRTYRIKYLYGYSSSLFALAQEVLRQGRCDVTMTVAITNAEPLFEFQRRAIAEAFRCDVRETYGMAEIVAAASECNCGSLHLWPEVGVVEVLARGNGPAAPGAGGDLVCTGLLNEDMPLIRYRVGDRVAPAIRDARCACDRTLPLLASIEGRADDLLYMRDGRVIGRLDPVFKAQLPVREAQIIQEAITRIRVRFVPADGFTAADGDDLIERLRSRLGSVDVVLEPVAQIARGVNGKFRTVICRLPIEQRQAFTTSVRPRDDVGSGVQAAV